MPIRAKRSWKSSINCSNPASRPIASNGSDFPTATIPQWGTCDADNSVIAYLQDQLATTNLDYQQTVIDQRALYDLRVNLKQRGC
jgi:hypothetical protein